MSDMSRYVNPDQLHAAVERELRFELSRLKVRYNELLTEVINLRNEIALYGSDDPYTPVMMLGELNLILEDRERMS